MKKISVIVPVYNTRDELNKCLSSICRQTYQNLEIILVDDGSTDGSQEIVDEFARKDARVVAIHQKNRGESNARNTGLKQATGDYIAFCDCDDWLEENMYEQLALAMETYDADLAAGSWIKSYDDHEILSTNRKPVKEGIITREELLRYIYERDSYQGFAYIWSKLYKRETLTDQFGNIVLFDESFVLGGDIIFLAQAALNTNRAVYVDQGLYHYYQRNNSGCHTVDLDKRYYWLKSYEVVIDLFEKEEISEVIIGYVKRFLAYHSGNMAVLAYEQKRVEMLKRCQGLMRRYEKEYMKYNADYPERIENFIKVLNLNILASGGEQQ